MRTLQHESCIIGSPTRVTWQRDFQTERPLLTVTPLAEIFKVSLLPVTPADAECKEAQAQFLDFRSGCPVAKQFQRFEMMVGDFGLWRFIWLTGGFIWRLLLVERAAALAFAWGGLEQVGRPSIGRSTRLPWLRRIFAQKPMVVEDGRIGTSLASLHHGCVVVARGELRKFRRAFWKKLLDTPVSVRSKCLQLPQFRIALFEPS